MFAINGMSASKETVRLLQREGMDYSAHMARGLTREMVDQADVIFVMERLHVDEVLRCAPAAQSKVHLLKTFGVPEPAAGDDANIPDPIGKPLEVYEACFATIREAVARVATWLTTWTPAQ